MSKRKAKSSNRQTPKISPQPAMKSEWSAFKTFLLSIFSAILIFVFLMLPYNKNWLQQRIAKYYDSLPEEWKNQDLDYRMIHRWGGEHSVTKILEELMDSTSVFLIPPQTYLVENMFNDKNKQFHIWTYPSLLYYHIDHVRLADMHSPDSVLATATHTVWVRELNGTKDLIVLELNDQQTRDQVVEEFRKHELLVLFDPVSAQNWLDAR